MIKWCPKTAFAAHLNDLVDALNDRLLELVPKAPELSPEETPGRQRVGVSIDQLHQGDTNNVSDSACMHQLLSQTITEV